MNRRSLRANSIPQTTTNAASPNPQQEDPGPCDGCFPAGTEILTPYGEQPIQTLKAGDMVLAENSSTGKVEPKPVQALITHSRRPLLLLSLRDGSTLKVTADHPFWVDHGPHVAHAGWIVAGKLVKGDELRHDGSTDVGVTVLRPLYQTATVYNLTIAADHTFFVGSARLLVHNCQFTMTDAQFGKKAADHLPDYGRDPGNAADCAWLRAHIYDIVDNASEFRQGPWRGDATDNLFYEKGGDVVVTTAKNVFVTNLKDGITSGWFQGAKIL